MIATPWTTNAWGRPHIASLGDWTGDGVPDAVWDDSLGTARLLSFEGGELMQRNLPIARTSRVIGAGDVEQDSRAEIVTNVNLAQLEILAPAAPSPTATTQPHHLRITARRRCRVERHQFQGSVHAATLITVRSELQQQRPDLNAETWRRTDLRWRIIAACSERYQLGKRRTTSSQRS